MSSGAPFITFEGIEGSGKTTLSRWLAEWLGAQEVPTLWTCEPGGSELGVALRHTLLQTSVDPLTELFLFLADRAHHVRTVILPALHQGLWVICDRYTDSTLAYQGYGRRLNLRWLRRLNEVATHALEPNLTFLIDVPVQVALTRTTQPNRFEQESLAFHERVRKGYLRLAEREPERFRFVILDGTQPIETLQRTIQHTVQMKFCKN
ncbi:Thymidylate kinase [bacterium HR15]|nr:Thymidylate kinase [bacterium HR15]